MQASRPSLLVAASELWELVRSKQSVAARLQRALRAGAWATWHVALLPRVGLVAGGGQHVAADGSGLHGAVAGKVAMFSILVPVSQRADVVCADLEARPAQYCPKWIRGPRRP
jgi:hypothetical protein